jgi:hypothetical protein
MLLPCRLGVGEKELQTMSWPDLVERVVRFQSRQRLCIVKELSAHDIVSRIMRKENYTIGMLNKNVLALEMPSWVPGAAPLPGSSGTHKRRQVGRKIVCASVMLPERFLGRHPSGILSTRSASK